MLGKLIIQNYALIEQLELDFQPGMSVITGETGAGKSIMLGALSMLLGARADLAVNSDNTKKTIVEARFYGISPELLKLADPEAEPLPNGELIIRREISPSGRSRSFLNDSPVNLKNLGLLADHLIDIHSQHNNLLLGDPSYQLSIIDAFLDDKEPLRRYKELFRQYVSFRHKYNSLKSKVEEGKRNAEFNNYRTEYLSKLNPKKGELQELEKRLDLLTDAGQIRESLEGAVSLIYNQDDSALSQLRSAADMLGNVNFSLFENKEEEEDLSIPGRLESLIIELKDIAETLSDKCESVEADPNELAYTEQRISALYEACTRFGVENADQLVTLREESARLVLTLGDDEVRVQEMEKELKLLGQKLRTAADALTAARQESAERFASLLVEQAMPLGMQNLRFSALISRSKLTAEGQDNVEFLCAFNRNQTPMPLQKVASGGEISRLMLCLKSVMAEKMQLPTIIFDEIDTGVSGDIAARMGQMMSSLGKRMQVIVITHLPQVAAQGIEHYKVFKTDQGDRTLTSVVKLDQEARRRELAAMLSGTEVSEAALRNAETLLKQNMKNGKK